MAPYEALDDGWKLGAMTRIEVDYRLLAEDDNSQSPAQLARRIAYEQTVELPEAVVTDAFVNEQVVGRVERLETDGAATVATLSYHPELAHGHLPGLLNLVFGNVSMYPGVRVEAIRLPAEVRAQFPGPRFGIEGVRSLLGVRGRPLLATALKPQGLSDERLAELAYQFVAGGGDIVKDDQNLIDDLDRFKQRVRRCADAVARANDRSARQCLYFPHVSAPAGELGRYLDFVHALGLHGVLLCPMVLGLDTVSTLMRDYPLVSMAHPALTGAYTIRADHGLRPDVLLGTLFRLAGADISIFPSYAGRFSYSRAACLAIQARLREPLGDLRPAWACPAGGMQFDDLPDLGATYGPDSVLLVGGALYAHRPDFEQATREFAARIAERFSDHEQVAPASAPGMDSPVASEVWRFAPDFQWSGRPSSAYKSNPEPHYGGAFQGVRRVELVGKYGERVSSDLRYFEVAPGGYTSHERHVHPHIIIAARGSGTLVLGNRTERLEVNDVAYVAPLEAHQLRNDATTPFGFFCMVDHERDRPMPV